MLCCGSARFQHGGSSFSCCPGAHQHTDFLVLLCFRTCPSPCSSLGVLFLSVLCSPDPPEFSLCSHRVTWVFGLLPICETHLFCRLFCRLLRELLAKPVTSPVRSCWKCRVFPCYQGFWHLLRRLWQLPSEKGCVISQVVARSFCFIAATSKLQGAKQVPLMLRCSWPPAMLSAPGSPLKMWKCCSRL